MYIMQPTLLMFGLCLDVLVTGSPSVLNATLMSLVLVDWVFIRDVDR